MHFEPDDDTITFRSDNDDTSETCSGLGLTQENYGAGKKERKVANFTAFLRNQRICMIESYF